jgi:1-deoxy-D-xylulose 5-phosphate reductoisomerase
VTNAANEVAVERFLQDRIHIGSIIDTVFSALAALLDPAELSYGEILDADRRAREYAAEKLGRL